MSPVSTSSVRKLAHSITGSVYAFWNASMTPFTCTCINFGSFRFSVGICVGFCTWRTSLIPHDPTKARTPAAVSASHLVFLCLKCASLKGDADRRRQATSLRSRRVVEHLELAGGIELHFGITPALVFGPDRQVAARQRDRQLAPWPDEPYPALRERVRQRDLAELHEIGPLDVTLRLQRPQGEDVGERDIGVERGATRIDVPGVQIDPAIDRADRTPLVEVPAVVQLRVDPEVAEYRERVGERRLGRGARGAHEDIVAIPRLHPVGIVGGPATPADHGD